MSMKKSVKSIASKGRYGDTELLHVNKRELAGLASLMPGGKLTKNPDTGLPEAFFFLLPFLSGLGAAAAPAAAATAAGAGLAAEAAAATAAASTAAAAAAPALAASALPAAGLTGAGLAAEAAGTAALPAMAATAAPAMSGLTALAEGSAALPAAATAAASPAAMAASALPAAAGIEAAAAPAMSAGLSSLAEAGAAIPAAEGGLGSMLAGLDLSQLSQLAPLAMMMPGGGGEKEKKPKRDVSGIKYGGGSAEMPGDLSNYGVEGGEFDFFQDEDRGYAEGGMVQSAPGDKEIIMAATQALLGQSPDPDGALMLFVKTFGEAALQDLAQRVKQMSAQSAPAGRFVQGPGTGTSDSVPAVIDGQTPAALSDGEFVVPADVVAGMGGGDAKQGANQLYGMMENVRKLANGGLVKRFAQGGTVTPFQQGLMSVIGPLG